MKKITSLFRYLIKAPIKVTVRIISHIQKFKLYDKWWISLKLEHHFGLYEREATRFFKKNIRKGMVVVDVGANVGYYTRIFSKLVGPTGVVYAFEPDTEAFAFVEHNTKHLSNVRLFPYAVSDINGLVHFFHIPNATSSHTMVSLPNAIESDVPSVTLDSFIKEPINVVKMDIEGAEPLVFKGMQKQLENVSFVVLEYTKVEGDDLLKDLESKGTISGLTQDGKETTLENGFFYPVGRGGNPYANVVYRPHKKM
jgi:FkbM family methyltransferase